MPDKKMQSGVVCIIGRPSAGKSTFLNSVCGETVSIVSALPQTTRSSVRGILTAEQGQIIFIDTPGYHISEKKINHRLKLIAENRLKEAEAVLYLVDAARPFGEEELAICALLQDKQERLIVGINKTDSAAARPGQPRISVMQALPDLPQERIFDLSAQEKTGLDPVLDALFSLLPEGDLLYPEDFYTDQPVDFRIDGLLSLIELRTVGRNPAPESLVGKVVLDSVWQYEVAIGQSLHQCRRSQTVGTVVGEVALAD